jgi:transcription initiation factor TFIIIB Brf1 subunit/transcription initiation factor TFIIB
VNFGFKVKHIDLSMESFMKKIKRNPSKRLSPERVLIAALKVWQNQLSVATDVSASASKIIQAAYEKTPSASSNFFSGRSEKGILSGLFYRLALSTVNVKTQHEIASALGTTETTVRVSSRDWLDCFPELF